MEGPIGQVSIQCFPLRGETGRIRVKSRTARHGQQLSILWIDDNNRPALVADLSVGLALQFKVDRGDEIFPHHRQLRLPRQFGQSGGERRLPVAFKRHVDRLLEEDVFKEKIAVASQMDSRLAKLVFTKDLSIEVSITGKRAAGVMMAIKDPAAQGAFRLTAPTVILPISQIGVGGVKTERTGGEDSPVEVEAEGHQKKQGEGATDIGEAATGHLWPELFRDLAGYLRVDPR